MKLPARKKSLFFTGITALIVLTAVGCSRKEKAASGETAGIKEVQLELRSQFRVPADSIRWEEYLSRAPQDTARAWLMLGVLYLNNNYPEIALGYLNIAYEKDPQRPIIELNKGDAYNRMRQFDKATQAFREFLRLKPETQLGPEIFRIVQKYRSIESEKLIP